jgi:hypothetical protein
MEGAGVAGKTSAREIALRVRRGWDRRGGMSFYRRCQIGGEWGEKVERKRVSDRQTAPKKRAGNREREEKRK